MVSTLPGRIPLPDGIAEAGSECCCAYRQYVADNHLRDMVITLDLSQKSNLAFGTTRPPETYIIDPQGRIRRKFIGAQDWTSPEIENYLRNL